MVIIVRKVDLFSRGKRRKEGHRSKKSPPKKQPHTKTSNTTTTPT